MSNALAIATVTTALAHIVRVAAQTVVSGADVLTERPDANPPAQARVRLFLYQVTPNAALRNRDLANRSADGKLVSRPVVALDLHYLLSFYGNENELEPQRMLGAVARDLHTKPALMRQAINDAVASQTFLNGSNLADALEQVKFTPMTFSLDELGKIWSILFQTPYALSIGYQATAVLIDSEDGAPSVQPVLTRGKDDRGVDTLLGPFPVLESVHIGEIERDADRLRQPSYPAARLGAIITLRGRNLGGDKVSVSFAHPRLSSPKIIEIPEANRTATQMIIAVQQDATPPEWAAGIYSITVISRRGDKNYNSKALPFSLAPQIMKIEPAIPIKRDGDKKVTLTITCAPTVLLTRPMQPGEKPNLMQRAVLLLADREVPGEFPPLPEPPPTVTDKLIFVIENAPLVEGTLLHLRIDDLESLPFKLADVTKQPMFDDSQKVTIQ